RHNGDNEVDGAAYRRNTQDLYAQDPEVRAVAGHEGLGGKGRVLRPPAGRAAPFDEEGAVHHQPGQGDEPQAQGVDARVRHVLRADHQRQTVVTEAGAYRDDEEEEHGARVHRGHLVVGVLAQNAVVGPRELQAHEQRQDTAGQEEPYRDDQVHDADLLVVGRQQPIQQPAPGRVRCVFVRWDSYRFGCHDIHTPRLGPFLNSLLNQHVQNDVEEDPHYVNKVPVKHRGVCEEVPRWCEVAPVGAYKHHRKHAEAGNDVGAVEAGHNVERRAVGTGAGVEAIV